MAEQKERYVIIRSRDAGCFAGILVSLEGDKATLKESRRMWYWAGAASLSQLAVNGTSQPNACKFPIAIPDHQVLGVCEVIDATEAGRASIEGVPVWRS